MQNICRNEHELALSDKAAYTQSLTGWLRLKCKVLTLDWPPTCIGFRAWTHIQASGWALAGRNGVTGEMGTAPWSLLSKTIFAALTLDQLIRNIKRGGDVLDSINLENINLMEEWVGEESELIDGEDLD
ncbi:uncharacterized protein LOC121264438 [Juglans microcarpa x Juglans regia]|uniref:uncharacterized protein LOC121264438 n=1 Tax=Juglans microcarpa x Juglans regia TaxID=2249226 RepID=UPI001B7EC744|nr:uncharacterized protein LOC121264438 [Juglans microcarpa x Juglans regia]